MLEMEVVGVRVEMPSNQPIVLLKEKASENYLPIWIGTAEATAIALAQQNIASPRPMTHDLLVELVGIFGGKISKVSINSLDEGVFKATLDFEDKSIECRPSDAIVIALKLDLAIFCDEEVLQKAQIEVPLDQEQEVDQFRQFLDEVNPEDFGSLS
ncbi:MAG: hypothetical protein RL677_500 [Actinomycetota bacterium]